MKRELIMLCAAAMVASCTGTSDDSESAGAEGALRGPNSSCIVGLGALACGGGTSCYPLDPNGGNGSFGRCTSVVDVVGQLTNSEAVELVFGLPVQYKPAAGNPFPEGDNDYFDTNGGLFQGFLFSEPYLVRVMEPSGTGSLQQVPWTDDSDADPDGWKVIDLSSADPKEQTFVSIPSVAYQPRMLDCNGQSYDPDCTTPVSPFLVSRNQCWNGQVIPQLCQ
jgi:hypothetical protein